MSLRGISLHLSSFSSQPPLPLSLPLPLPVQCRQLMIDVVLATDMAIHFELLKNFNLHMEATPDVSQWQDRSLLYRMIVHLADIANPSRPFSLARGWAERVIQEFCEQVSAFAIQNSPSLHSGRASLGTQIPSTTATCITVLAAHTNTRTCRTQAVRDVRAQLLCTVAIARYIVWPYHHQQMAMSLTHLDAQ